MKKNEFAVTPPMGWNSYDYYDTTVTEVDIKANADYMAANLKEYGWEYIVVDIQWYARNAGTRRDQYQYIPFDKVEMDDYSRLYPCVERFPSSFGGRGFLPLADYVHQLGLKFGIHMMRGIPRIAAHNHYKILGTDRTADEIADPNSICSWNSDMYGINPDAEGAQEYYNSVFELYAKWGVDFVKCDDICRMDASTAKKEIMMIHKAIMNCGRPIVLSLSPGPAKLEEAWYYSKYANMWRITDDLWDKWEDIYQMFELCERWQRHAMTGCYPDCDMLPIGTIGKGFGEERTTRLTQDEQITMFTLWSICRSPLMLGCELTKLDDWTLKMITKKEVLKALTSSHNARQIERDEEHAVWYAEDEKYGFVYLAVFNFCEQSCQVSFDLNELDCVNLIGRRGFNLWTAEEKKIDSEYFSVSVNGHGANLYKFI